MSTNQSGKWLALWVVARRVAAPVIPLLLGAAAMALLLDSGTVHLPPIRSGAGSSAAPAEKVVVSPPAVHRTHHPVVTFPKPAAPATPAAGTTASGVNTSPGEAGSAPQQVATGGKPASKPKPPTSSVVAPTPPPAESPAPPAAAGKLSEPAETPTPHGLKAPKAPKGSKEQPKQPKHPAHPEPPKPPGHEHAHPHGPPLGHAHHVPPGLAKREGHPKPRHSHGGEDDGHDHGSHGSEGHGSHGRGHGH